MEESSKGVVFFFVERPRLRSVRQKVQMKF